MAAYLSVTGMPLDNKITFTLPSDTNFHDRDTLRWSVRFRFHNGAPDSIHAPLMAMQVLYEKNDSVISAIRKVQDTGVETLTLFADTLGEIKEIRGFIYYPQQETPQPLLADRISLMRYTPRTAWSLPQRTAFSRRQTPFAKTVSENLRN